MKGEELKAILEAIVYVAEEPVTIDQLSKVLPGQDRSEIRAAMAELVQASAAPDRGIEVREVAGGYRLSTKPEHHEVLRQFIKALQPPLRLSLPALETLAVVAYKQPVTLPEIQEIRGVNTSGVIHTLLEKKLITTAGRKHCIGRPILYRTSKEFLVRFGLKDLNELPSLEEFEELAKNAFGSEEPSAEQRAAAEAIASGSEPASAATPQDPYQEATGQAGKSE